MIINISPNRTSPRNHKIDTITIHCFVGQVTAQRGCEVFANSQRKASANYVVGYDGSVGMSCPEEDRSWCSSNAVNDNRAITIEVASETTYPYKVTDAALKSLIDLLVDVCKRNNIKQLLWKNDPTLIGQVDKQNMTLHRWFANKACPGDYLIEKHPYIVQEVNSRLGVLYRVQCGVFALQVNAFAMERRLMQIGFAPKTMWDGKLYIVNACRFSYLNDARDVQLVCKRNGIPAILKKEN